MRTGGRCSAAGAGEFYRPRRHPVCSRPNGDGLVKVWDVETGKELRTLRGHSDRVDGLAFTADGRYLLTASWDWTMRLWDVNAGEQLRSFQFQGEPGVHVSSVTFFPDGKRFL